MTPKSALPIFAFIFALAAPAAASASPLDAAFDILRKGDPIGFHAVDIEETPEGTIVDTRIRMRVRFGPVTLFHYDHEAREIWRDGALRMLTSRTNNNGRRMTLDVVREGDALIVDGQDYQGEAPPGAIPSSYWNKAIVDADYLLNTQTGALIPITRTELGETAAPSGAPAEQYRLTGTVALDLWYDDARWVGADFVVRGEALTYRLADDAERQRLFAKLDLDKDERAR
jgi:hypothetical protein